MITDFCIMLSRAKRFQCICTYWNNDSCCTIGSNYKKDILSELMSYNLLGAGTYRQIILIKKLVKLYDAHDCAVILPQREEWNSSGDSLHKELGMNEMAKPHWMARSLAKTFPQNHWFRIISSWNALMQIAKSAWSLCCGVYTKFFCSGIIPLSQQRLHLVR